MVELPRPGDGLVAEVPDDEPARDVGLVDAAVVPVRRPVAAELRRDERGRVGVGDLLRRRRVREVDDANAGLVVPRDEDVARLAALVPQRDDVVVVDGAVLLQRLLPREDELAMMTSLASRSATPKAGYAAVQWVLLNSSEFALNH